MEISTAYWASATLFTALRLGLFDRLAEGLETAAELSGNIEADERSVRLLLDACTALGLVEHGGDGRFRNTPESEAFLVERSPACMANAIRYGDDMYAVWGRLEEAVREGRNVLPATDYLGKDPERTRHFVYGMHDRAMGLGTALVERIDLSGRRRLLDVGGGPGTCSALFTLRNPGLEADVLDLPPVVALADEILASMGGGDRVGTIAGDYHVTGFPAGYDVVLISGVFHRESPDACRDLVRRAHECLEPGGLLIVCDVFTDTGGTGPVFATLFGLNMMLSAPDGGVHADSDVEGWMREAGFGDVVREPLPPPMPHRIVIGTKKQ